MRLLAGWSAVFSDPSIGDFALATAGGVLMGKLLNRLSPRNPLNPLIGVAGVPAVPMAARVAQAHTSP